MQGRGPGTDGDRLRSAYRPGELLLEGLHVWAEGGDHVAGEDVCHKVLFDAAHVRGGQVDSRWRHCAVRVELARLGT